MSIETEEPLQYHHRKAAQAWEMSGLARVDGDHLDAKRYTGIAREHDGYVRAIRRTGACPCPQHTR